MVISTNTINLQEQLMNKDIPELFSRLPDLTVTGPAERLQSMFIHGIKHMPCTFTPGRSTGTVRSWPGGAR